MIQDFLKNLHGIHLQNYLECCTKGTIFFLERHDLVGRINKRYQSWKFRRPIPEFAPTHVGIIGDARGAYESLFPNGPTRNLCVDRYLLPKYTLKIGVFDYTYTVEDMERGMAAIIRYIQQHPHYDWLSLVPFLNLQESNSSICSSLISIYANEVLRHNDDWKLQTNENLVLPWEWLDHCQIIWESH